MSSARCKVSGCRRKAHARGLCQKHYDEQRKSRASRRSGPKAAARPRSGRLPAAAPPPKPVVVPAAEDSLAGKLCCVPGCANPHHAKGYCKSHYGQLRRRGRIEDMPGDASAAAPLLSREQRLVEIKKRHELLKREIATIHKALESETGHDSP